MKNIFIAFFCALSLSLSAQSGINLAGVFEVNSKVDGLTKQMYAVLDFNNLAVKDFTQQFSSPTAKFSTLPEDFMNSKKLKKSFAGQTAAGYVKFREKYLLSATDEIKLTNPRLEDGVIMVDWETHQGVKGSCAMRVNKDKSIEFLGLTSMERSLSPDNLTVACVEDRSMSNKEPVATQDEAWSKYKKLYSLRSIRTKVSSPLPYLKVDYRICEQIDNVIVVKMVLTNKGSQMIAPCFHLSTDDNTKLLDGLGNELRTIYVRYAGKDSKDLMLIELQPNIPANVEILIPANGRKYEVLKLLSLRLQNGSGNEYLTLENMPVFQREAKTASATAAAANSSSTAIKVSDYADKTFALNAGLTRLKSGKTYETVITYAFEKAEKAGELMVTKTITRTTTTGSSYAPAEETYYRARIVGSKIVLYEEVDFSGEAGKKIAKPIVVNTSANKKIVTINAKRYTDIDS